MEKKYSNEDFANFIVEKVSNLSDANNPVYPYMVFCDCIDEFEDKTYLENCIFTDLFDIIIYGYYGVFDNLNWSLYEKLWAEYSKNCFMELIKNT